MYPNTVPFGLPRLLEFAVATKGRIESALHRRRIERLRDLGMYIGRDVNFPGDLYVDERFPWLVHIDDSTSFGPECMILAHEAFPTAGAGPGRLGRVVLHRSCHIGARTIVLPGVEVGPRTVVAANALVSRSLPPDTVCAGRPARPFSTLEQYLDVHRRRVESALGFDYAKYSIGALTPERRAELVSAVMEGDTYIVGGRSAELRREGGTARTALGDFSPVPPNRPTPRQTRG